METVKLILAVSLTVNVSLLVYFFPPILLVWFISKQKQRRMAIEFLRFNKKNPNVLRKLFRDSSFSTVLFIFGIYILVQKRIRANPFEHFVDTRLQTAMAVQIGNQLFRLVHASVPSQDIKRSFLCTCYEIVTIFSFLIILIMKENNLYAVVNFLFEGGILFSDIFRAENQWCIDACAQASSLHVVTLLGNLMATLAVRVVCPTVLLTCAIHEANFLKMSYVSMALFILNTIFYYTLSSLELFAVCKGLRTRAQACRGESRVAGSDVSTEPANSGRTMNNSGYSAALSQTSSSLIALNNLESQNGVSGIPQTLHASTDASRSRDHVDRIVIKNF